MSAASTTSTTSTASAMNISRNNNIIAFSGDMTKDFNQMRGEMSGRFNMWVGDVVKVIPKLGDKLTTDQLMTLHKEGTHAEFYENNNAKSCKKNKKIQR